jgi:hypothetical protein
MGSVGKPEGKRPLERHRRTWEHNIKMDLRDIGWGGMDCFRKNFEECGCGPIEVLSCNLPAGTEVNDEKKSVYS